VVNRQRGSVSLVVAAMLAFAAIFSAFTADATRVASARARAQTAADAAALAAAQELVAPSGRAPDEVAAEYAERHGATVTRCDCDAASDEVTVSVSLAISLPYLAQTRTVEATARAVVTSPAGTEGLQPFFAARLSCLFARVEGLWIVSGFRTRGEQAELFERKPALAAPPGHSNHELGLAADLGYPSDAARASAHEHATGCGLVYPMSYEPWHVEPAGM